MHVPLRSVAPLFLLSGVVALGCEAVWFRALGLLFGASLPATGALLGAFMAGLALGSAVTATTADRLHAPLRAYAMAEGAVGVWALIAPWLIRLLPTAAAHAGSLGRVCLAFALLVVPTTAMGATLPLLAAAVIPSRARFQTDLGRLYAVNLAGAVLGVLTAGFWLIPHLGLAATLRLLGVLALTVAGVAWRVAARGSPVGSLPVSSVVAEAPGDPLAVLLGAGVGTVSFALQVCWNRALGLLLGSSAYTFATVSAVILVGLALGGAVAARSHRGERVTPWPEVVRRCLALAVTVWLGTLVVLSAPVFLASAATHSTHPAVIPWLVVTLVVGPPSWQVGALFPLLAARMPSPGVGRAAGIALLATTAGNVGGSLGAAFVAVPAWGLQTTLVALAAVSVLLALLAGTRVGVGSVRAVALAGALGYLLNAVLRPHWDAASLSAGTFRTALYRERVHAHGTGCDPGRRFTARRVMYYREGAVGTVLVLGFPAGPACSLYSLRIDGKAEGSVFVPGPLAARLTGHTPTLPVGDLPTEVLAGLLPALTGPTPSRALLVGWGTGISSRALLDAGAHAITAVELEPAVLEAARIFDADALRDPRVDLQVDDARVVLRRLPPDSVDMIASHPSNPWVVGAASLFSREYFTVARDRLRDGGRMLAWVQLYETDREAVRSLVATFLTAFPDAHVFQPSPTARDLLLLGIKGHGTTSAPALRAAMGAHTEPAVAVVLARAGIPSLDALMERRLAGGAHLADWSRGAVVTTEDNAWLEYRVAGHLRAGTGDPVATVLAGLAESTAPVGAHAMPGGPRHPAQGPD